MGLKPPRIEHWGSHTTYNYRVKWYEGEKPRSKGAKTLDKANEILKERLAEFQSFGDSSFQLDDAEKLALKDWRKFKAENDGLDLPSLPKVIAKSITHYKAIIASLPIGVAFLQFMEFKTKAGIKKRHRRDIQNRTTKFIESIGEDTMLPDIKKADADDFLMKLYDGGADATTVINYRSSIRIFFNYAVENGLLSENPFSKAFCPKVEGKETKYYLADDFYKMLAEANYRERLQILLVGYCGVRIAESARVKWSQVDFDEGTLKIPKVDGKNGQRLIRLMKEVVPDLWFYFQRRVNEVGSEALSERVLLVGEDYMNKLQGRLRKKVGVTTIQNGLRHAFCSYHYRLYGDWMKTTAMSGHEKSVFDENYDGSPRIAEANRWLSMVPFTVDAFERAKNQVFIELARESHTAELYVKTGLGDECLTYYQLEFLSLTIEDLRMLNLEEKHINLLENVWADTSKDESIDCDKDSKVTLADLLERHKSQIR